jgi:hypothetical protein
VIDQVLTYLVVLLPTLFAVVLEVVNKEIKDKPRWRVGVFAFGVGLSVLTAIQISHADRIHRRELEESGKNQRELQSTLDQSLLNQQYTKGQLESISIMVGRPCQPSLQGEELAHAIKQMAQANAQNASDLKASNGELCKRAQAKAEEIRVFEAKYEAADRALEDQVFNQQRLATTDQERHNAFVDGQHKITNAMMMHSSEFRSKYMPDAKYLRDLLMDRVSPKAAELLKQNNSQAEINLSMSRLDGTDNEYGIANYLDELARAVCPQTAKQKMASQAAYHAIAARLHEFESQASKFHDRCYPTSKNPPSPSEVDEWINEVTTFVRGSSIEEHLKNEYETPGVMANATFSNVAPGCANLMGKINDEGSKIYMLEQSLAAQ